VVFHPIALISGCLSIDDMAYLGYYGRFYQPDIFAEIGDTKRLCLAVQVFFCKFREGDFSVVVITLSG
jgi:hypothetical protein